MGTSVSSQGEQATANSTVHFVPREHVPGQHQGSFIKWVGARSHIFSTFHELRGDCKCQSMSRGGDVQSTFGHISKYREPCLSMRTCKSARAEAPFILYLVTRDPGCNKRSATSLAISHNDSAIHHSSSSVKIGWSPPTVSLQQLLYMQDRVKYNKHTWWDRNKPWSVYHMVI